MGKFYDRLKKRGVEIVEDLAKMPPLPEASSVVQRLKDASERAYQKRFKALSKWRKRI